MRASLDSSTARSPAVPRHDGPAGVAFGIAENLGAPDHIVCDAQSSWPHAPLPTLRGHPHGCTRTARGGSGGRPFLPAGLSPAAPAPAGSALPCIPLGEQGPDGQELRPERCKAGNRAATCFRIIHAPLESQNDSRGDPPNPAAIPGKLPLLPFLRPDITVVPALHTASNWASGIGYQPAAVATFLQVAVYWLVAHALAHDCTVVTHEVPADTIHKTKIPNACIGLGLNCVNPYDMLRRERARFVLGPDREVA